MTIAITPQPPYYAVIFSAQQQSSQNPNHDHQMVEKMTQLAKKQEGFLGIEKINGTDGFELTISYWDSLKAIQTWKKHTSHQAAKHQGKDWYLAWKIRICKVEHDYESSINPALMNQSRETVVK